MLVKYLGICSRIWLYSRGLDTLDAMTMNFFGDIWANKAAATCLRELIVRHVYTLKTQLNLLFIREVWVFAGLYCFRRPAKTDQTARMRRLIWVIAGHTCLKVLCHCLQGIICLFTFSLVSWTAPLQKSGYYKIKDFWEQIIFSSKVDPLAGNKACLTK